jgi:hypothetical protein
MMTGRKPWTSATSSDPVFRRYLRDPMVLPAILSISPELNKVPSCRLAPTALEATSLYSFSVVFEGSVARLGGRMGIDSASTGTTPEDTSQSPDPRSTRILVPATKSPVSLPPPLLKIRGWSVSPTEMLANDPSFNGIF